MKSMLKQIYYGNKGNGEHIKYTETEKKISIKTLGIYEEFIKDLPEEKIKLFDKLMGCEAELQSEYTFSNFKEGFKIGLFLGMEMCEEE